MNEIKLFVIPKPIKNPKLRVFFFPFAGGSISTFVDWIEHFDERIEIALVQPPGRGGRILEQPHDNMADLVSELFEQRKMFSDVPYVIFGHSLGSRVAFELVCQLVVSGFPPPKHFIASGSKAPHLPGDKKPIYDLPDEQFIDELEKLNGTPKEVLSNKELMELLLPLLRADFKIADTHKARQFKIKCPILVLGGLGDIEVELHKLQSWADLSEMKCNVIQLEGDHFFINQSAPTVIEHVKTVVNEVIGTL